MSEKRKSVLIIDDDPSILRTLSRVLSKAGYAVETAQTGKEATAKFTAQSFNAALIDVRLNEMKGTDLLPQMQKAAPNMMKILLTGTPMPESMLDEAKQGADVFLLKPVAPEILLDILAKRL